MHRNGLSRRNNGNGKDEPNGKGTQKTRTAGAVHFHGGDCGGVGTFEENCSRASEIAKDFVCAMLNEL